MNCRTIIAILITAHFGGTHLLGDEPIRFGRDILPILSTTCYACHGPDASQRKANLRFDLEEDAKAEHDSGVPIVLGKPDDSTLIQRITSTDPDVVMPPPDAHRELKPEQIVTLQKWVAEGAKWGRHWSFEPVERPQIPVSQNSRRSLRERNGPPDNSPIDTLNANTLVSHGLAIRPSAEPHQLARRIWLDVIGLPPTPEAADTFAANPSDAAYEKMIDDLLASPQFGEHWARMWMDLARYADTKGYEKDLGRTMWPYRDWLIRAINNDMPLDQMTVEQLAGDLLPKPTNDQLVATAFHRNTMSNDEGGTDDEEFRTIAVKDRVDTTMQVWMGLTAGCAKCHTHKYDPISQAEYYGLYAILNQTQDTDRSDDSPTFEVLPPEAEAERTQVNAKIADLKSQISKTDTAAAKVELPQATPEQRRLTDELAAASAELQKVNSRVSKVPVMRAVNADKLRATRIHRRGNFLDSGDEVNASLPAAFHSLPKDAALDRLGLAKWLMSPDNTLTPRVWVNRIWARIFGIGIVETEEDFGALGAAPSHPELLDWLAAEYRDNGWSLKKFVKTILMSRTYRQRSDVTDALRQLDPQNRLLSRGSRYRLPAETVRDQALAVSGLLSSKIGGPPVMPPQPDGLWRSTYNGQKWVNAEGEDRFRRALYTYLKRTTPYPSMTTFDGGSGEVCQIRRIRTNTPLQALVTLNDPVYLEAAGALAMRMTEVKGDDTAKATRGLRLALIRPVSDDELGSLLRLRQDAVASLELNSESAKSLIKATRSTMPEGVTAAEFASWIVVANTILNLDEFLTKN